jgi:crossover junction endodeoxyribonuclease RuvC
VILCGADVGLSGALAFIDTATPSTVETFDLPVHLLSRDGKKKRELDASGLLAILTSRRIGHAFIEQQNALPGQGLSSTFALAKCYGIVIGLIVASGIPYTLVAPIRWKKAMGVSRDKDASRARASQLLPASALQWRFKKDHGKAESALIALFGLRALTIIAADAKASHETTKRPEAVPAMADEMHTDGPLRGSVA